MSKTASLPNELYFVTLTVVDWIDIFTRKIYFDFIIENLNFCQQKKHLEVYEYVIMTNHIHMICLGRDKALSDILRDFKTFTSKEIVRLIKSNEKESRKKWMLVAFRQHGKDNPMNKDNQFWQNMNSPTLLYNNKIIDQKMEYIQQNPVKAGFVVEPFDWLYSSAHPDSPLKIFDF
jgi:REP element-mobilizing transposase RayT